ncbi:MAG: AAA family ATPase [Phycisphaerae bacterium]
MIDKDKLVELALRRTESNGIVFIDEIDKVGSAGYGPDVSRMGVQAAICCRSLRAARSARLWTSQNRPHSVHRGSAFHMTSPNDLLPEMQGRFPIRVELKDLNRDDFVRILTEPESPLIKQQALMSTEGVTISLTDDAISEMADIAIRMNGGGQNIGLVASTQSASD